jgi:hypothetical protein
MHRFAFVFLAVAAAGGVVVALRAQDTLRYLSQLGQPAGESYAFFDHLKIPHDGTGVFTLRSAFHVNPDLNRIGPAYWHIDVVVRDPVTLNIMDRRDYGPLMTMPHLKYVRQIEEKMELPPGRWRVQVRAAKALPDDTVPDPDHACTSYDTVTVE